MAKQEQLDLLRQGVEIWNQWRQEFSSNEGSNLECANSIGADLEDANLSGSNLISVDLGGANLSGADLSNANLKYANLSNADLEGADLSNADLSGSNLINANLSSANLSGADLSSANLKYANLSKADLEGSNLSNADLSSADLEGANLSNADLSSADLEGANLSDANLSGIDPSNVDLSGIDLSSANLSGIDLSGDKFSRVDLSSIDLWGVKLRGVNLSKIDLSEIDFSDINLRELDLSGIDFRGVNLSEIDIYELKDLDLSRMDFSDADLHSANLSDGNLNGMNLSNANLSGADFTRTQALATNFTGATLTGACLEDWNINSETKLDGVICEYVYLKQNRQERRPSDPNQVFGAGQFTKLFWKAVSTVDLIFRNGVDWEALSLSLNKLKVEAEGVELSVQSIENKDDGTFVVRINTPPGANKAEIEKYLKREYSLVEKVLHDRYQHQLQLKDVEIDGYRRENTNLLGVVNLLGGRPINAIALSGSQSMGDRNISMGSGNYNERIDGNYIQGNCINMSQDLTQAAQQIQDLLQQLQNQGVTVEDSQQQVANDIAKQAETNPTMMGKLVLWGKAMANKASETTVSEAAKIVFTLALKAAGVS